MAEHREIFYMIHLIEVRFVISYPFHKEREKDGAR
jgi:hypothetical protein